MAYECTILNDSLSISSIVSCHYFQYMSDFFFPGECHDFWELVYVDAGEVIVIAQTKEMILKRGEILFHKPNEFHNVRANGSSSPSLIVISFYCHSIYMDFFADKKLLLHSDERHVLARIIAEARLAFVGKMDDPYLEKLTKTDIEDMPFGAEQLIRQYINELLIVLYRKNNKKITPFLPSPISYSHTPSHNPVFIRIRQYMIDHIHQTLCISDICKDNLIGRSQLEKLFRKEKACGVIDYFIRLKIDIAKKMIRDNQSNFTHIADTLGYSSIHYFSRQFKTITKMTPSEYLHSVQILAKG